MAKIFLSSHGHMASGMKSSLDILIGNTDIITAFDAYVDDTILDDKVDEFYQTVDPNETVLLISDLYGGSVNQVLTKYCEKQNTYVITGVNLAMLMELVCVNIDELSRDDLKRIVDGSKCLTKLMELDKVEIIEEEFF